MEINGIPCEPAEYYDKKFSANPKLCHNEWSIERNNTIIGFLSDKTIYDVIEIAAGTGEFAIELLKNHPKIKQYFHTDFSKVVCDIAFKNLKEYPNISVDVVDVYKDLDLMDWTNYDLFVCNSMEHFPIGIDYDILKRLMIGTKVILSMATFPIEESNSHPHVYKSLEYVKDRYKDILDFNNLQYICGGAIITSLSIKK